jgi:hypothetical protein
VVTQSPENDPAAVNRARQIARKVIDEGYDPLLACRDLDLLRWELPGVPREIMNEFTAVASEIDHLPLAEQRDYWAPGPLRTKDFQMASYRALVYESVISDMKRLLIVLGELP